jgi:hypothetical protein
MSRSRIGTEGTLQRGRHLSAERLREEQSRQRFCMWSGVPARPCPVALLVATASASTRDGRRILEAVAEAVLWVVLFVEGAPWRAVVLFGSRFYSLKVDKR